MATTHKLLVIHAEDGVVTVQEVGVEDNLDAVAFRVEQLDTTNLVKDRIAAVIGHVVSCNGWEGVTFESEDTTLE